MYGYEWGFRYLWRWMNWLQHLDVFVLVLMLVHVAVLLIRVSHRCHFARLAEATDNASVVFQRGRRKLVADLNLKVSSLKSIASTAPFLGLVGTCIGVLNAFRGGSGPPQAWAVRGASDLAAALIPMATGLLVAVPAIWSHNFLRTRIDLLESGVSSRAFERRSRGIQVAQRLPLAARFSKLPFAVIAASVLALVIPPFVILSSFHPRTGLYVSILRPYWLISKDHLLVQPPLVLGVVGSSSKGSAAVYVNSKKTPRDELDSTIRMELEKRERHIAYLEAESNVPWADVANVIDLVEGLHADVVLLTATPDTHSGHKTSKLVASVNQ